MVVSGSNLPFCANITLSLKRMKLCIAHSDGTPGGVLHHDNNSRYKLCILFCKENVTLFQTVKRSRCAGCSSRQEELRRM
jgi:Pyruvate/2-oxoacid:ferredoxin oxidoreductase delta subunit